jgi:hypothetical protein
MHKSLFLVCPTDGLEYFLKKKYGNVHHFYGSLGNALICDAETIGYLSEMIEMHGIEEVWFVLSYNNKILLDALERQNFSDVKGLNSFYQDVINQKEYLEEVYAKRNFQFGILSFYLNKKIKELQIKLRSVAHKQLKIQGKIYDAKNRSFQSIYSDLIYLEKYHLN